MILDVCDNADILKIFRIINIIITIIRISVPIILIVSVMLDYLRAVKDNDELSKYSKLFVTKIVAAILVFLIPTFVNIIAKNIGNDSYLACLPLGTSKDIEEAYVTTAYRLIEKAKNTLSESDYEIAKSYTYRIKDERRRNILLEKLEEVRKLIDLKNETSKLKTDYDYEKYKELEKKIMELDDHKIKEELLEKLKEINGGQPLNVVSGWNKKNYKNHIDVYNLYIPENPTTNMPMLVFMPAVNNMNYLVNVFKNSKLEKSRIVLYIPNITFSGNWQNDLRQSILDICEEYKIDKNRISVTGFSTGGWNMYNFTAANKDLFCAMLPVSVGHTINSKVIQDNLDYFKKMPMKGYGESTSGEWAGGKHCTGWTTGWTASTSMSNLFNGLGKSEYFTSVGVMCHSDISEYVFNLDEDKDNKNDALEWLIKQSK